MAARCDGSVVGAEIRSPTGTWCAFPSQRLQAAPLGDSEALEGGGLGDCPRQPLRPMSRYGTLASSGTPATATSQLGICDKRSRTDPDRCGDQSLAIQDGATESILPAERDRIKHPGCATDCGRVWDFDSESIWPGVVGRTLDAMVGQVIHPTSGSNWLRHGPPRPRYNKDPDAAAAIAERDWRS